MVNSDLEYIKRHYSETLAHICRKLFPTILETPGLLPKILEENFAHSSSLGQDILEQNLQGSFASFIIGQCPKKIKITKTNKTAEELFDEAGYILYPECKTEDDIQQFRKYYYSDTNGKMYDNNGEPLPHDGEEICTFSGGRLDLCRVWFAVKKNVDNIKRENFPYPQRQDEYGTSVISIQFTKGLAKSLTITNRYNHSVQNPDATFSNNLDNIIPGLTDAFRKEYNIQAPTITDDFLYDDFIETHYIKANNNKYYRYNLSDVDFYLCENNIFIDDGKVVKINNEEMLIDNFILNLKEKTLKQVPTYYKDSFVNSIGQIEKIEITKNGKNKTLKLTTKENGDVFITINNRNNIINYENNNIKEVGDCFLYECSEIKSLTMNNLSKCGSDFLNNAKYIESLNLPNLTECGDMFLLQNETLNKLDLPMLSKCGANFLADNKCLKELNLPNLTQCEDFFLKHNINLTKLDLPNLQHCGKSFLVNNEKINEIKLQNLFECDDAFLMCNQGLRCLDLPSLQTCKNDFVCFNKNIEEINLPKLTQTGNDFLKTNNKITKISLPNLESVGYNFMEFNNQIQYVNMPKLKECKGSFLIYGNKLEILDLPNLIKCGNDFLFRNNSLHTLNLPKLQICQDNFLVDNNGLKEINLPNLKCCGENFLYRNNFIEKLNLPKLQICGKGFMFNNLKAKLVNLPYLNSCGEFFMYKNEEATFVNLPNLTKCDSFFMANNKKIETIYTPKLKNIPSDFLKSNKMIFNNATIKSENNNSKCM